jgi:nucleotide-binding universal stress UspA family protein
MIEQQNDMGQRIVVGVDGSSSSRAALRWAVRQAELTGADVEALTAWRAPTLVGLGGQFAEVDARGSEDGTIKAAAESMLRAEIDEVAGPHGAQIKAQVGEGSAAQLLLDVADGATMVVVGSRGHGGLTGTLLGSVGQTLAQHAPCPVLIIRGLE